MPSRVLGRDGPPRAQQPRTQKRRQQETKAPSPPGNARGRPRRPRAPVEVARLALQRDLADVPRPDGGRHRLVCIVEVDPQDLAEELDGVAAVGAGERPALELPGLALLRLVRCVRGGRGRCARVRGGGALRWWVIGEGCV